jgi:hypothetical protein
LASTGSLVGITAANVAERQQNQMNAVRVLGKQTPPNQITTQNKGEAERTNLQPALQSAKRPNKDWDVKL